jgi:hypothetical protein
MVNEYHIHDSTLKAVMAQANRDPEALEPCNDDMGGFAQSCLVYRIDGSGSRGRRLAQVDMAAKDRLAEQTGFGESRKQAFASRTRSFTHFLRHTE